MNSENYQGGLYNFHIVSKLVSIILVELFSVLISIMIYKVYKNNIIIFFEFLSLKYNIFSIKKYNLISLCPKTQRNIIFLILSILHVVRIIVILYNAIHSAIYIFHIPYSFFHIIRFRKNFIINVDFKQKIYDKMIITRPTR